jgi:hypothetical protein
MNLTINDVLLLLATLSILNGIYKFVWIVWIHRAYNEQKKDKESFFDFCCEFYKDNFDWKLRKRLNFRWYYNSKLHKIFTRFFGFLQVLIGIAIIVAIFFIKRSAYGAWLNILF